MYCSWRSRYRGHWSYSAEVVTGPVKNLSVQVNQKDNATISQTLLMVNKQGNNIFLVIVLVPSKDMICVSIEARHCC
jgi:hypothetical protein